MTVDESSTVAIGSYLVRGDAEVAHALLASNGIASYVTAQDEGGLSPGFFSEHRVMVVVNEGDVGAARAVLGLGASLFVPSQVGDAIAAHSQWAAPNEACGLIAGTGDAVEMVFCLTNRVASPVRYTIDPREHFGASRFAERCGWPIIGAWHSHPTGDAALSSSDVAESPGGDWITMVVGGGRLSGPRMRAFRTRGAHVAELAIYSEPVAIAGA